MGKRLLFISHDSSRTGAPLFLLYFLRWLKAHSDYEFELVLLTGGELEAEYGEVTSVTALRAKRGRQPTRTRSIVAQVFKQLRWDFTQGFDRIRTSVRTRKLLKRLRANPPDLIYQNTMGGGNVLELIEGLQGPPLIVHAHEMSLAIKLGLGVPGFLRLRQRTDFFIAASRAVQRCLMQTYGIGKANAKPPEKPWNRGTQKPDCTVIYEGIDAPAIPTGEEAKRIRSAIRRDLGIPDDAIVIGMCGVVDWRKGTDLFVALARDLCGRTQSKPLHFVWVGGGDEFPIFERCWVDEYGVPPAVAERMHFLGHVRGPGRYITTMDVFSLTSREDPFPLAHLEAAYAGIPIVCFKEAGGAEEWITDGAGIAVPFLDVSAMAEAVQSLIDDGVARITMGQTGAKIVRERFTMEGIAPQVKEVIDRMV
jgi:glycosyltransferase involved in cell wall biosynthesis